MALKTILTLLAAMQAVQVQADSSHPLHMATVDAHTAHAMLNAKGLAASRDGALYNEQGFWFSHFSVGGSPDLQILIDTGSSDTILNPGVYKKSSTGVDTGKTFRISYATTNPDGSGTLSASGEIYTDVVSQLGTDLTVAKQAIGDIRRPTSPPTFPHDGLIGYAGIDGAALRSSPFFQSLCDQGTLTTCRFGLSLKTDGTGTLHYGAVATGDFSGSLVTVPTNGEWSISGDITVNGNVITQGASIITDSGTTVVFGPTDAVKSVFQAAGIQAVENQNGVTGYYACDQPPQIGVSFNGQNFNIEPSALAFASNGNNCTASVHGSDSFGGQWLVGQAWFQGKYIDHSVDDSTMGFATLT